jgi:tRNA 2-thiouridine synthesizing protein C
VTVLTQHVLFIASRSPWSGGAAAAGADVLMTAAVFEQAIRVVFCGDGVWQLFAGQDGDGLQVKTLSRIFPAFELYDIKQINVLASSLVERALQPDDLLVDVELVSDAQVRELIAHSKAVFVF